jgi:CRISPR-associated protein Cmr6
MPIAALPGYLGQDFKDASPGMRFGMYLTLWGINRRTRTRLWQTHDLDYEVRGQNREEREVKNENKVSALSEARRLTERDRKTLAALGQRQHAAFLAAGARGSQFRLEALATAPFTTGLGNEHPLENGFAFLNPYGLPYLPGSGVKGVLRQGARELSSGDWGDGKGWNSEKRFNMVAGKERISLSMIDALFGLEAGDGETQHVRGALAFWDVIPQIKGDSLMVEIMTPHQSHYYQGRSDRRSGDSTAPHESGQPTPISFLTVPPGSGFAFHVQCDLAHLNRLAPSLAADGLWQTLLVAAFEHAFAWLGFGAKTAVGYGAMKEDPQARQREEARLQAQADAEQRGREEEARQATVAQMSPIEREIWEFLDQRQDRNQPEVSALLGALKRDHWSGESKVAVAKHVMSLMNAAGKWREKSKKKNPDKDHDYQDTLKVLAWLNGK